MCNAASKGYFEIVKYLVGKGCDPKAENSSVMSLITYRDDLEMDQWLDKRGFDLLADNNKPIVNAAKNGHLEIVQWLCEQGCDPSILNNSAIIGAAANGHLAVIRYLHRYDPTDKPDITDAIKKGDLDIIKEF